MRKKLIRFLSMLCIYMSIATSLFASTTVSSTKDCTFSPCSVTSGGTISITTTQLVHWEATVTSCSTCGHDFYLSTGGSDGTADFPVFTGLHDGFNQGDISLPPGNYRIGIRLAVMGEGGYSITFNIGATIHAAPTSFTFSTALAGGASSSHSFSITKTGDPIAVSISSITSSDAAHFSVSTATPFSVPGSFSISFNPGSVAGTFSSTISITASATGGTVTSPITAVVSGTVENPIPMVSCGGGGCGTILGTADYTGGGHTDVIKTIQNTGTAPLHINSITLSAASTEFSIINGGGAGDVPAMGSRSITIRYTPTASEHTSCGRVIVNSNDPSHPVLQCDFGARAHHPEPRIRIAETLLDYRDVEQGFSYKKAITVFNDGDADLHLTATNLSAASPDFTQWESVASGSTVVHPGSTPQFYEAVFKPNAISAVGSSYNIDVSVAHDDPTRSTPIAVHLTGRCTIPIPMDNVLVLDRSGSMSESLGGASDKIHGLRNAASLYLDLLRNETGGGTGDKIGLVTYNQNSQDYLPFDFKTAAQVTAATDKLSDAALTDVARLQPDGSTGIGGGMQRGASMLTASPADRKHIMVVMTDGMQNEHPFVDEVLPAIHTTDPNLKIYSLGLGSDAQVDHGVLQSITNVTNGFHQVSDNLAGTALFSLEDFYFKIYSNANGMSLAIDPTVAVSLNSPTPVEVSRAHIVSSDRYAAFLVLDDPELRSFYKLELVDPNGQIMQLGAAVSGLPIQYFDRYNYKIYKVVFPDISNSSSYVGDWVLRLSPNGKWDSTKTKIIRKKYESASYNGNILWQQGQAPVGFMAAVKSDYVMTVGISSSTYQPGAAVSITATLTDRGWPSLNGTVAVDITKPDNSVVANIVLNDNGTGGDAVASDGVYSGNYTQTSLQGTYKFFFHATGRNERGELVPREDSRYLGLYYPSKNTQPDSKECIPCYLVWIMYILIFFLLLWSLLILLQKK